jgi:hypothetical protein
MRLKHKMLYQEIESKQEKLRAKEQHSGDDYSKNSLKITINKL